MKLARRALACMTAFMFLLEGLPVFALEDSGDGIAYVDFTEGKSIDMTVEMGSGEAVEVDRDGRKGWQISDEQNDEAAASIYIELSDSFAGDQDDGNTYEVEIDYYDEGSALFNFIYNSWDKERYFAGRVITESLGANGTAASINQWRTATFRVQDGDFKGKRDYPDLIISAGYLNRNRIDENTINEFGRTYGEGYLTNWGKSTTRDPIVIGAVRVRKLETKNPLEVKASYDFAAYTIFNDEPAKINYSLENKSDQAYDLNARYEILDSNGYTIREKEEPLSAAAGEIKEFTVDLGPVDRYGELTFRATFSCDGIENVTEMPLCHAREPKEANERLGTNVHFEGSQAYPQDFDGEYELIKRGGYSSTRDTIRWYRTQTSPGVDELNPQLTKELEYQEKYDLDFLPNAAIDDTVTGDMTSPETLAKFSDHCEWLAKTYKGKSEYIQTENEWNIHAGTQFADKAEGYMPLLKATYEGLKRGDPDVKILGVCWAGYAPADFRNLFDAGCLDYIDAFSYQYYWQGRNPVDGNLFKNGEEVRELLAEYGHEDMPVIMSECGWNDGFDSAVTTEDTAQWHAQLILQNSAWKTFDKLYTYEFANSGEKKSYTEACFGAVESAYGTYPSKPKPAYYATTMANWALSGTEFIDALDGMENTSRLYAYRYSRDNTDGLGNNMIALWHLDGRKILGLDLGTDKCRMYDMYGNECELNAVNGVFTVTVSERPMYLIGDFDSINEAEPQVTVDSLEVNAAPEDSVIQTISIAGAEGAELIPCSGILKAETGNTVVNGTVQYTAETPSYKLFNERAEYDIVKDGAVIYHGDIKINGADTVTVSVEQKLLDEKYPNRWGLDIYVTNNRNSGTVSGTISVNAPSEFAALMKASFKDLKPRETRRIRLFMPEIQTKEMRLLDMTVNVSGYASHDYSKRLFFTVVPYADTKPVVDGIAGEGEYDGDSWFLIRAGDPTENNSKQMYESLDGVTMHMGDEDLSAKATMKYDDESIWFFIDVTDDVFVNNHSDDELWNGDSVQMGIADEGDNVSSYCELTAALTPKGPQIYRHYTNNENNPVGLVTNMELAIVREGNHTRYEIRLPWSEVLADPSRVEAGYRPKFALLINEDDGKGRNAYMEYSNTLGALGTYKNISMFSDMILAE